MKGMWWYQLKDDGVDNLNAIEVASGSLTSDSQV
jgi:hypothetical protein